MKKRIVLMSATLLLGVTPLIGSGASVFAAENDINNVSTIQSNSAITNDEKNVLDKLTPIFPYFFIENNKLSISLTDEELTNKFGYDADFIATIHKITKAQLGSPLEPFNENNGGFSPAMSVSSGKIWLSNNDIKGSLGAAAMSGPAAVYAAFVAMGGISLGPVGLAISGAIGVLGMPSLAGFTYNIVQAVANGQGVYIGVTMNGVFPNIVSGTY